MPYIVCEPCVDCRYTECATVCPVDAFRRDERMVVIQPDICIDCDACEPVCPVKAIYPHYDVPDQWQHYIQLNRERSKVCPVIRSTDPVQGPISRKGKCKPIQ